MYLPSLENLTSEIDEMISEKKDLFDGSSSSSNSVRIGEEGGGEWNVCVRIFSFRAFPEDISFSAKVFSSTSNVLLTLGMLVTES